MQKRQRAGQWCRKAFTGDTLLNRQTTVLSEVPYTLCSELDCNRHMVKSHRVRKNFEASCPAAKMQLRGRSSESPRCGVTTRASLQPHDISDTRDSLQEHAQIKTLGQLGSQTRAYRCKLRMKVRCPTIAEPLACKPSTRQVLQIEHDAKCRRKCGVTFRFSGGDTPSARTGC